VELKENIKELLSRTACQEAPKYKSEDIPVKLPLQLKSDLDILESWLDNDDNKKALVLNVDKFM